MTELEAYIIEQINEGIEEVNNKLGQEVFGKISSVDIKSNFDNLT